MAYNPWCDLDVATETTVGALLLMLSPLFAFSFLISGFWNVGNEGFGNMSVLWLNMTIGTSICRKNRCDLYVIV